MPIPVTAPSKGVGLGHLARIPLKAWIFVFVFSPYVVLFCVGKGLCDELITCSEESYDVYTLSVVSICY
jgi:hypothetical protein